MGWEKNKESSQKVGEGQKENQEHLRPQSLIGQHGFKKEVVSNAAEISIKDYKVDADIIGDLHEICFRSEKERTEMRITWV